MIPSSLTPIANHLWQSTVFVIVLGLITLLLKNNRAHVRSLVWLAASIKFLLPFSLLVAIGSQLPWIPAIVATPAELAFAVEQISQPFNATRSGDATPVTAATTYSFNELLLILVAATWVAGSIAVLVHWLLKSRRIRAAVRNGIRIVNGREVDALRRVEEWSPTAARIKVISSADVLEPGIVGIFRPVLLLPAGITDRLPDAQLDAIITHEVCHVHRRDNLTAALHMIVEALFWFHPLVWWLGKRLVDEREKACDEEVLRRGNLPQVYAEGILKVCEFYVESPIVCAAGVTGSDLKKRIEDIMTHRVAYNLNIARKALLFLLGIATLASPILIGLGNAAASKSVTQTAGPKLSFEVASIKPNTSADNRFAIMLQPGGRFTASATLRMLMATAYRVRDFQISGGPAWVGSDRWDIEARPEAGSLPPPENLAADPNGPNPLSLMLQSLLEDRFQLKIHRETKELPVYELLVMKGGVKIRPSEDQSPFRPPERGAPPPPPPQPGGPSPRGSIRMGRGQLEATGVPLASFINALAQQLGRPVIDKTDLKGLYDIKLEWTPEGPGGGPFGPAGSVGAPEPATPNSGPSIFTAVQEILGLRLDSTKGPVETIVVDSVARPSEN